MAKDEPFHYHTEPKGRSKAEATNQDLMDSFLIDRIYLTSVVEVMKVVLTLIFSTLASDIPYICMAVIQASEATAYMISVNLDFQKLPSSCHIDSRYGVNCG